MKVKDVWLGIFIFLLVIFFGLYFSSKTGYYETEEKNKTILTLETSGTNRTGTRGLCDGIIFRSLWTRESL